MSTSELNIRKATVRSLLADLTGYTNRIKRHYPKLAECNVTFFLFTKIRILTALDYADE